MAPSLFNSDLKRSRLETEPVPNWVSVCFVIRVCRLVWFLNRAIVRCAKNGRSSDSETDLTPDASSRMPEDLTPIHSTFAFDGFWKAPSPRYSIFNGKRSMQTPETLWASGRSCMFVKGIAPAFSNSSAEHNFTNPFLTYRGYN